MPNITQKNWPLGWLPSDDEVGGNTQGALRMDNLSLDERGIISLSTGTRKLLDTPGTVHSLYSKYFDTVKSRFYGVGGSVYKDGNELFTGGNELTNFSSALGYVLIASGGKKKKHDGTHTYDLGLTKPSVPTVKPITNPNVSFGNPDGDMTVLQGEEFEDPAAPGIKQIRSDATGIRAILSVEANPNIIDGNPGTSTDQFWHRILVSDTALLTKMRIVVALDDDIDASENYFWKEFSNDADPAAFNQGLNTWTTLTCLRSDFERAGSDNTKTWDNCTGVRLEVVTSGVLSVIPGHFAFFGGGLSTIDGKFTYIQVNVHSSSYQGKSAASPQTPVVEAFQGVMEVTPSTPEDDNVNEIWIYRRSAEPTNDITRIGEPRRLDRFYRVKVLDHVTGFGAFRDEVQDKDALFEGEIVAEDLASLRDIDEDFIGFSGLVRNRVGYLTNKNLYISAEGDLDSYNPRHTVRLSGSNSEINLFCTSAVDSMLVATTEDFYEISGTFQELNDGSLDIAVRPLGIGRAASISRSFTNYGGTVFYFASDGWHKLAGGSSERLTGSLDLLLRNQNRHGFNPVAVYPKGTAVYAVVIYNEQLWAFTNLQGGGRTGLIYDFASSSWSSKLISAVSAYVEEDGTLIAGFGGGSGNAIRQLDYDHTLDGGTQQIQFITAAYDGDMTRNRKDLYTLKILGDTGGSSVTVFVKGDNDAWISCGAYAFGGAAHELVLNLHSRLPIAKRLAFQIVGQVSRFKLYQIAVEFDPRPEQLTYKRIENTNLGTLARKRFTSFAFVLDTLGHNVRFVPFVDNTEKAGSTALTLEKLTHVHYFGSETVGTDIGGYLESTDQEPFEYYGPNLEETVSEKLPSPTTFLVIPAEDYGNPNRKRHSSYKFQLNSRGADVRFTPVLDGVQLTEAVYNTTSKRTVEYFFANDTIGIDIGGELASVSGVDPFEFYGTIKPQDVEVLPPRLKEKYVAETNFGIAAKKRLRTLPFEINTNGADVYFVPAFDGVPGEAQTFNTPRRKTVLYYITTDVFCIDVACDILGVQPFEFYGLLKPEDVEILPVGKRFDQIGPVQYDRIGKLLAFRVRAVFGDTSIPYTILTDDNVRFSGTLTVEAGIDSVWEVKKLPATISARVYRIEIGPTTNPFHRWDVEIKAGESGLSWDSVKWRKIK